MTQRMQRVKKTLTIHVSKIFHIIKYINKINHNFIDDHEPCSYIQMKMYYRDTCYRSSRLIVSKI